MAQTLKPGSDEIVAPPADVMVKVVAEAAIRPQTGCEHTRSAGGQPLGKLPAHHLDRVWPDAMIGRLPTRACATVFTSSRQCRIVRFPVLS